MSKRREKTRGKITWEGWAYVVFTTLIGLLAVNTGNNILFGSFSFFLSLFITSGIISSLNLKGLEFKITLPKEIYKKQSSPIEADFKKKKKGGFVSLGIKIEITIDNTAFLSSLNFKEKEGKTRIWVTFEERGRYRLRYLTLISSFPLGFVMRRREISIDQEFLVFPAVKEVDFPPGESDREGDAEGESSRKEGVGGEFLGLRSYHPGDNLKRVFWKKATTSYEQLLVKQFSSDYYPKNVILRLPPSPSEEEIDLIASQSVSAIKRGYGVGLELPQRVLEIDYGDPQRIKILTYLSLYPRKRRD